MAKNKKKASTEIKADLDAMFSKKSKVIKKKDKKTNKDASKKSTESKKEDLKKDVKKQNQPKEEKKKSSGATRYTKEGYKIYTAEDLKIGQGGDGPDCPFDCDCCF